MIEIGNALNPLLLTLKVASLATFFSFLAGVVLARFMAYSRFRGKEWLDAILTLPLVLPPTVLGYYLIVFVGRKGWLGQFLWESFGISLMFTWQGAVLASAVVSFPLVFKSARASFEAVDHNLEKAARTLGFSEMQALRLVRGPLAFRLALPPMTNDFVALLKDSSLVSVITVVELTKQTSIFAVNLGSWLVPGLLSAAISLATSLPLARLARRLEARGKEKG